MSNFEDICNLIEQDVKNQQTRAVKDQIKIEKFLNTYHELYNKKYGNDLSSNKIKNEIIEYFLYTSKSRIKYGAYKSEIDSVYRSSGCMTKLFIIMPTSRIYNIDISNIESFLAKIDLESIGYKEYLLKEIKNIYKEEQLFLDKIITNKS